jgi:hypothetical protein
VLFGKSLSSATSTISALSEVKSLNQYDAYLVLAGYAYLHEAKTQAFEELYQNTNVYGDALMMGVNNVFSTQPASTEEVILFIRKMGFVLQHAASQL